MNETKVDRLDRLIDELLVSKQGLHLDPEIRLWTACIIQAIIEKDCRFINEDNKNFISICKLCRLNPDLLLTYREYL